MGDFAFGNATSLTSVDMPLINRVGWQTFWNTAIESVNFPDVTVIERDTFSGASKLSSVDMPLVEIINHDAFRNTRLVNVSFLEATYVGNNAFNGISTLETVNIPAVETIGNNVFQGATSLESVNMPAIRTIGNNVFEGTGRQELTITMGDEAPVLGWQMFTGVGVSGKNVTVLVQDGATGFSDDALPVTYTDDTTTQSWGNRFRGAGSGTFWMGTWVNTNITLTIQEQ